MKPICLYQFGKTEIKLHPVMLAYFVYAYFCGYLRFALIASASICLHETAHALTAALAGKPPSVLALTPIGAVMYLEDEEDIPWGKRLLVFAAGPVMTLFLCFCALWAAEYRIMPLSVCRDALMGNLAILLLNLIPALPLDGGRLMAIVLSKCMPERYAFRLMRCVGMAFGGMMIFLNVYISWQSGGWNLSLAMAGCCILYSSGIATRKRRLHELKEYLDRRIRLERKGRMQTKLFTVQSTLPLVHLVRHLPAHAAAVYACCEMGSMKILGWVSEFDAVQHYLTYPAHTLLDVLHAVNGTKNDKYDTI